MFGRCKGKHKVIELSDGTIDLKTDPLTEKLLQIERLDKESVRYLNSKGFNELVFKKVAHAKTI